MTARALEVWGDGRVAGQLTQNPHGELGFAYSLGWLQNDDAPPLSASLPKHVEPFSRRECRPFFGGLLPEESRRDAAAQALGVSRGNDFALLDRLGGDVAGALQLLPPGETPAAPDLDQRPIPLGDGGLIRVLDALPVRPLLAGEEGLRLSLAGAQSKVPVVLMDGAVALPAPGQPTTHILKPRMSRFSATTENEAFVTRLAAAGLGVAAVEPRIVRDRTFLLVQRFDRSRSEYGGVRRIQHPAGISLGHGRARWAYRPSDGTFRPAGTGKTQFRRDVSPVCRRSASGQTARGLQRSYRLQCLHLSWRPYRIPRSLCRRNFRLEIHDRECRHVERLHHALGAAVIMRRPEFVNAELLSVSLLLLIVAGRLPLPLQSGRRHAGGVQPFAHCAAASFAKAA